MIQGLTVFITKRTQVRGSSVSFMKNAFYRKVIVVAFPKEKSFSLVTVSFPYPRSIKVVKNIGRFHKDKGFIGQGKGKFSIRSFVPKNNVFNINTRKRKS